MKKTIYPCLWFDGNAAEAANFYCSLFNNAQILQQTPVVTTFELDGTLFMGLNGGPMYRVNPAISYFVYCGGSEAEVSRLYTALSEGGSILMPLDKYDWSSKYAWVEDRFGVNWQLDIDNINSTQKIVPALLFANQKKEQVKTAIDCYAEIFKSSKILMEVPYPPTAPMPEGTLLFAQYKVNNFIFNAISSYVKHDFDFSPANSFVIECEDQAEIDYYWDKLGQDGGRYEQCGWLADKFGVSWQIVPAILPKLMTNPQSGERVMQALLKMQKIDIEILVNS